MLVKHHSTTLYREEQGRESGDADRKCQNPTLFHHQRCSDSATLRPGLRQKVPTRRIATF
jgi:hypothetical protein